MQERYDRVVAANLRTLAHVISVLTASAMPANVDFAIAAVLSDPKLLRHAKVFLFLFLFLVFCLFVCFCCVCVCVCGWVVLVFPSV